jgi:phosphate transport system substrate-binding protein
MFNGYTGEPVSSSRIMPPPKAGLRASRSLKFTTKIAAGGGGSSQRRRAVVSSVRSTERQGMSYLRSTVSAIGLSVMMSFGSGCGSGGGPGSPAATIVVDGSSTVVRISEAAQEEFKALNPAITVTVDEHGTGGGFSRYLQDEADIVDASRPAKPDEEAKAKAQGIEWTRFVVGYDGITVVGNPKNDFVKSLSVAELKAIWEPGSKIKTWKDLNSSWPARPIVLYSPDNDSGTYEFFTGAIVGINGSQRQGVQQSSSDNTLVLGVAGDQDGLGYFGYAYYSSNQDKLRAIAVRNGSEGNPVLPSPQTIADKTYAPLSRPLFIFVKNLAARRPEVAQFVKYYVENIESLSAKGGYSPPTSEDKAANLAALSKLLAGNGAEGKSATSKSQ